MAVTIAKAALFAAQHWKKLVPLALLLLMFPLMFFSTTYSVVATVPGVEENQMRIYIDTSSTVGLNKSFINYKELIAIDTIRYKQDFSLSNGTNIRELAERFLLKHEEITNYNFSSYSRVVEQVNSELGINVNWREVVMVDSLLTSEQFNKNDDQIRDLMKKFYRITSTPYEVDVPVQKEKITRVWISSDPSLPDQVSQAMGKGRWVVTVEYYYETERVTKYKEDKVVFTYDQVLLNLGYNTDRLPQFFNNILTIQETMQKVIVTWTTKSMETVMTELGMTAEQIANAKVYRDIGMTILNKGGAANPFTGGGEAPSGSIAEFIERISPGAKETQGKYGVYASISIAQAILESGWGTSGLTTKANNLFGIKANDSWTGSYVEMPTQEFEGGRAYTIMAKFRAYPSWAESLEDHGRFLKDNSRYAENGLFNSNDYIGQAYALQSAGYATAQNERGEPMYAVMLIELVQTYGLYKYDS